MPAKIAYGPISKTRRNPVPAEDSHTVKSPVGIAYFQAAGICPGVSSRPQRIKAAVISLIPPSARCLCSTAAFSRLQ
ncbi:hypothetical protein ACSAZL_13150 [Methanosarcina sp. T3]|uniref:hypothetical protein n=1 Tax=Methanosarcina sp. T3 TaxID=3439062 RepID=UPI003F85EF52